MTNQAFFTFFFFYKLVTLALPLSQYIYMCVCVSVCVYAYGFIHGTVKHRQTNVAISQALSHINSEDVIADWMPRDQI